MPFGPRKFHVSFDATGATRHGGLLLFQQFCKSIGLKHFFQTYVAWPPYGYRDYHPASLFLAHVCAIILGIGRIENTQSLSYNGLIPPILGLPTFPHRDTLRTFLWRFDARHLKSLQTAHDKMRSRLFQRVGPLYSAVIDADTTTLTTFGHQEMVEVGFNRKYRGKKSYAPIVASEGRLGLSLGIELRAGNIHSSTGAWNFLKEQLDKLPTTVATSRTRVRLDGGFYDRFLLQKLDDLKIGYVIVAHMTPSLKSKMIAARYHEFAQGWEAAAFTYPLAHWQNHHHFVTVRRPKELESEELRRNLFTFKKHTYHRALVVGQLDLTPEALYRFYCDRANQELLLREFKDSYHLAQIPTRGFWPNATFMEMILWAYDLVRAFQFLCLPEEFQTWNVATLRRDLWWLPAEWVKRGNRNVLRLPALYPRQDLFRRIQVAAARVKPLF
jgi:hypothetical protein